MSPATFQQAHERLVDTLYQSTSLKQKANRKWLLDISYVEHFWSNVANVSLPDMARAGGQAMLAKAGRVENEISTDWPSVYTNINIIVNKKLPLTKMSHWPQPFWIY
ncbi:hypothetical protein M404DRAFT_22296 [Pisolithus tinctorius Marx 270]|uniref:Uncharacterized protein n=1 Tax=Pisolithus tinctorius Marx 270 TaxID=870435 RepID=A0A0C3PKC2_PISTI|nr:hypothetical protein M404DRAFT_22296 [Pisolithus tinctorius Marx 270]